MIIHLIGSKYIIFPSFCTWKQAEIDFNCTPPSRSHKQSFAFVYLLFLYAKQSLSVCQTDAFVIVPGISSKKQYLLWKLFSLCYYRCFFFLLELGVSHLSFTPSSGEAVKGSLTLLICCWGLFMSSNCPAILWLCHACSVGLASLCNLSDMCYNIQPHRTVQKQP